MFKGVVHWSHSLGMLFLLPYIYKFIHTLCFYMAWNVELDAHFALLS